MKTINKLLCVCFLALAAMPTQAQNNDNNATPSDFTYGVYGGVGAAFPTGSVADNFKGSAMFQIGLTGAYQNFRLKTDVAYGQPSFKNRNIFASYDDNGFPAQDNSHADASLLLWSVQAGYRIYHGHRLSVTPNVGFVMSRYSWDVNNLEWSKDDNNEDQFRVTGVDKARFSHTSWIASIDFDIRLHTTITDKPFLGNGSKRFTSSIRITPFVAGLKHSKSVPSTRGCLVGATVSYLGLLQSLGF
jgi:hypothetical protein